MEKIKVGILTVILFLININNVSAACDFTETDELNKLASNVKVSYEVGAGDEIDKKNEITPPDGLTEEELAQWEEEKAYTAVFKVYVTNITEDLYVTVYDKLLDTTTTYQYSDTNNGTLTIRQEYIESIDEFTINVYSSDTTNCSGTKLNTLYLTTPMYNTYSSYYLCEGAEEFYLCHEYLSVLPVSFSEFEELVTQYKNGKINEDGDINNNEQKEEASFWDFIKNHKNLVIGLSIGICVSGGVVIGIVIKRKRSRVI